MNPYVRVYLENVKKFLIVHKIAVSGVCLGLFSYLFLVGAIAIEGHSGDTTCQGTEADPCYAYIHNVTFLKDVYIYPNETWMFSTDPAVRSIELQRSWGNGWRTVNLDKTYNKNVKYAVKWSMGSTISFRYKVLKNSPIDTIKWSFGDIDPYLYGTNNITATKSGVGSLTATYISYASGFVSLDIDNYRNPMDFDIIYLFNSTTARPEEFQVYAPRDYIITESYICSDYANYTLNPKRFYCYENRTYNIGTNSTPVWKNVSTTLMKEHDFDYAQGYTAFWNVTKHEDYKTVKSDKISIDYDSFDTAYYFKDVNIETNVTLIGRAWIDVAPAFNRQTKYGIFIKRSSDTFAQALSSNRFVYIDPWLDSSYPYAQSSQTNQTSASLGGDDSAGNPRFAYMFNVSNVIYNASVGTKYGFAMNALITAGKVASDCSNVLMGNATNTSSIGLEIEACNSANAIIWACPTYPTTNTNATSQQFRMFYGNTTNISSEVHGICWANAPVNANGFVKKMNAVYTFGKNGTGVVNDSSVNRYNATLGNNTGDYNVKINASGIFGNALFLSGANQYSNMTIPLNVWNDIGDNLTVSVWFKEDGPSPNTYSMVMNKGVSGLSGDIDMLLGTSQTDCQIYTAVDSAQVAVAARPVIGRWHNMVCTYDGANIRLYVDGGLWGTTAQTGIVRKSDAYPWTVGQVHATTDWRFKGLIDDLRIYNYSISAEEINATYVSTINYLVGGEETQPSPPQPWWYSQNATVPANYNPSTYSKFNITVITANNANLTINATGTYQNFTAVVNGTNVYWQGIQSAGIFNYSFVFSNSDGKFNRSSWAIVTIGKAVPVLIIHNNTASINTSGLVGYWRFEQSNGSAATNDSSGYGNKGTLTNMNLTGNATSGPVAGRFGSALQFDGVGDFVNVGNKDTFNFSTNDFSISFWINMGQNSTPSGSSAYQYPLDKGGDGSLRPGYGFYTVENTVRRLNFAISSGSGVNYSVASTTNAFPRDSWHYVVGIRDWSGVLGTPKRMYMFLDGVSQGSPADISDKQYVNNSISLSIGRRDSTIFFNGTLDEVMIWNRSLTANEVRMLYQSTATYGTQTNFTNRSSIPAPDILALNFYRNQTILSNDDNLTLGAGYYYYLLNTTGNANYTAQEFMVPLNITRAAGNLTIYLNGSQTNRTYEYGSPINITLNSTTSGLIFLDIDIPELGINLLNLTGTFLNWTGNIYADYTSLNESLPKNYTFVNKTTKTIFLSQMHANDTIQPSWIKLYGYKNATDGLWPKNVSIDVASDGIVDVQTFGELQEHITKQDEINGSFTKFNLSFTGTGYKTFYLRAYKNTSIVQMNITGFGSSNVLNLANETRTMCGIYTYDEIYLVNSTINPCGYNGNSTSGWARIDATFNISVDANSKINASGAGYTAADYTAGQSFDGSPGTGGGRVGLGLPDVTAGGGGGAHGGYGGRGGANSNDPNTRTENGSSYDSSINISCMMGSAGGGSQTSGTTPKGFGGGAIVLNSTFVDIKGNVTANGFDGANNAGGGGGAGGCIEIYAQDIYHTGRLEADGGDGGTPASGNLDYSGDGGSGSGGRIKLFYNRTLVNSTGVVSAIAGNAGSSSTCSGCLKATNGTAGTSVFNRTVWVAYPTELIRSPTLRVSGSTANQWSYTGTFTTSQTTANISLYLNNYIQTCTFRGSFCEIPIFVSSQSQGIIRIENLTLWTDVSRLDLNITAINRSLSTATTTKLNVSVNITAFNGIVEVKKFNLSFWGSRNYTITGKIVEEANYSGGNISALVSVIFSRFSKNDLFRVLTFVPDNENSTNVHAYQQTNSTSFRNVTNLGYDRPANMSMYFLNTSGTDACWNMTVAVNTNNSYSGFNITTTPRQIFGGLSPYGMNRLWYFVHFNNCNATAFRSFRPNLVLESYCDVCVR